MIFSISNIAWAAENDEAVYELMQRYGYTGLEIAPTRIFPEAPYARTTEAQYWSRCLRERYGFIVSSMQSIWYGRQENLFGTVEERVTLEAYTKKAVDFAVAIGCKNLVFGCPRNRNLPAGADSEIAVEFFRKLGRYAEGRGVWIGLEANPPIYHTNYINTTVQALELIRKVASPGFRLNLDVGTMVENGEEVSLLADSVGMIGHVHISEPGLMPIKKRELHQKLIAMLYAGGYDGAVSIEIGRAEKLESIEAVLKYVRGIV